MQEPFWIGNCLLWLQNGGTEMLLNHSVVNQHQLQPEMQEWIVNEHFHDLHLLGDV